LRYFYQKTNGHRNKDKLKNLAAGRPQKWYYLKLAGKGFFDFVRKKRPLRKYTHFTRIFLNICTCGAFKSPALTQKSWQMGYPKY